MSKKFELFVDCKRLMTDQPVEKSVYEAGETALQLRAFDGPRLHSQHPQTAHNQFPGFHSHLLHSPCIRYVHSTQTYMKAFMHRSKMSLCSQEKRWLCMTPAFGWMRQKNINFSYKVSWSPVRVMYQDSENQNNKRKKRKGGTNEGTKGRKGRR